MRRLLLPGRLPAEREWHHGKCRLWIVVVIAAVVVVVAYLVDEDGAAQAPPPRLTGPVEGAVLGDDHHVDSDAVVTGLFRRQAEVEPVAGVVLHDEEDARRSWRRNRFEIDSFIHN